MAKLRSWHFPHEDDSDGIVYEIKWGVSPTGGQGSVFIPDGDSYTTTDLAIHLLWSKTAGPILIRENRGRLIGEEMDPDDLADTQRTVPCEKCGSEVKDDESGWSLGPGARGEPVNELDADFAKQGSHLARICSTCWSKEKSSDAEK